MKPCDGFRPGCKRPARHTVQGYDYCTPCAQGFAGYTPEVTYYTSIELADILAETVEAYFDALGKGILHAEMGLRDVLTAYQESRKP